MRDKETDQRETEREKKKEGRKERRKESSFVTFVDFHGINSPPADSFKLPKFNNLLKLSCRFTVDRRLLHTPLLEEGACTLPQGMEIRESLRQWPKQGGE